MNKLLEPSLLAFGTDYHTTLPPLRALGIRQIHFDIMDGQLVAQQTPFTPDDLQKIHELGFTISVHYMGYDCLQIAQTYAMSGVQAMTFQYEALQLHPELHPSFQAAFDFLKARQIKCGIAFNPTTPFSEVREWVQQSDIVTVMSVTAGAGGQAFVPAVCQNLEAVYTYQQTTHPQLIIQIDGGVNYDNLDLYLNQVQWVVSGTSFYHSDETDKRAMIAKVQGD